jgi:hypothetical protein
VAGRTPRPVPTLLVLEGVLWKQKRRLTIFLCPEEVGKEPTLTCDFQNAGDLFHQFNKTPPDGVTQKFASSLAELALNVLALERHEIHSCIDIQ